MIPKLDSPGFESQQYEHVLRVDFIVFLISAEVKETQEEDVVKLSKKDKLMQRSKISRKMGKSLMKGVSNKDMFSFDSVLICVFDSDVQMFSCLF